MSIDRLYWLWLSLRCGAACVEFPRLVESFASVDDIYNADYEQYVDVGISERLASDLSDKSLDLAKSILSYCQSARVGIMCYEDEEYPVSLRTLKDPPIVLYYLGVLPELNRKLCIATVGTRKMSEYGRRAAYKIAYEIASAGAVVVSGMALGIDGIAASAAIAAKGKTVAVLGSGIDRVYPPCHGKLYNIIKQNGAVITEYPPAAEPRGANFPVRNRIISGLCQGTVVIDADMDSGAMITAKKAILQGRDIYAVPGNIDDENSSGTNSLIRDGAQAVLCGADVIKNYASLYRSVIDIQRMRNSERYSEYNESIIRRFKVGTRIYPKKDLTNADEKGNGTGRVGSLDGGKTGEEIKPTQAATKTSGTADEKSSAPDNRGEGGDRSAKALESLTEKQRKIFDEMPLEGSVTLDYFTNAGFKMGEVMSALTVLEIKGLIIALPGALYARK